MIDIDTINAIMDIKNILIFALFLQFCLTVAVLEVSSTLKEFLKTYKQYIEEQHSLFTNPTTRQQAQQAMDAVSEAYLHDVRKQTRR